jgi:hypothetical protein
LDLEADHAQRRRPDVVEGVRSAGHGDIDSVGGPFCARDRAVFRSGAVARLRPTERGRWRAASVLVDRRPVFFAIAGRPVASVGRDYDMRDRNA